MTGRPNMITPEQNASLERCYINAETIKDAAVICSTSSTTAQRYFKRFADRGVIRVGGAKRKKKAPRVYRLPAYTGPVWIGKSAA